MYHCICFCVGLNEAVKVKLTWQCCWKKFLPPFRCWTDQAPSVCVCCGCNRRCGKSFFQLGLLVQNKTQVDLGTKRLNRDRMLYLMFLCKVYDLSTSQYVGSEVNDKLEPETVTRKGIKLFTLAGMNNHDAKALMRVMLISALRLTPATASSAEPMVVDGSYCGFFFAVIVTILCITLGYIAVLRRELRELRGEKTQFE